MANQNARAKEEQLNGDKLLPVSNSAVFSFFIYIFTDSFSGFKVQSSYFSRSWGVSVALMKLFIKTSA